MGTFFVLHFVQLQSIAAADCQTSPIARRSNGQRLLLAIDRAVVTASTRTNDLRLTKRSHISHYTGYYTAAGM